MRFATITCDACGESVTKSNQDDMVQVTVTTPPVGPLQLRSTLNIETQQGPKGMNDRVTHVFDVCDTCLLKVGIIVNRGQPNLKEDSP
jgi:hypothetical protein